MNSTLSTYNQKTDICIRVMVVDDSAVIRRIISDWLEALDDVKVVACCRNGQEAIEKIKRTDVDIVVLDIEMPLMDGLTALPGILKAAPDVRVLMASTLTQRNAHISVKALALGATDYLPKPESTRDSQAAEHFRVELVNKVRAIGLRRKRRHATPSRVPSPLRSALRLERHQLQKGSASSGEKTPIVLQPLATRKKPEILAIGSSTGGPKALFDLFGRLKGRLSDIPVVLTQHMPPTFTSILAEHIEGVFGQPSTEGETGMPVQPGQVYVAPGGKHMLFKSGKGGVEIQLDDSGPVNFCKPSVDPMLDSLIPLYGNRILVCILTGMGSDGRDGCTRVQQQGGTILAQDEESSVVWGMPGSVAMAGICHRVDPVDGLARTITKLTSGKTP